MIESRRARHVSGAPAPVLAGPRSARGRQITAAALRACAFRRIKAPLLGRYDVRWHWPRGVDLGDWERVSFASRSGARIAALYGTSAGQRRGVVVCAHPLRRDAKGFFLTTGRAAMLRRNGYDVVLFDFNGFGESTSGDFRYAHDVSAAADYAAQRAAGLPVHALAACFGAVWTLAAATREHPLSGIVIESPLTSLRDYYAAHRAGRAFYDLLRRCFVVSAADAAPLDSAARLAGMPRLLVISGTEDAIAPVTMGRRMYETCGVPRAARRIWYVEGAGHLRAFETAPDEYEERVAAFFDDACVRSALVW